MPPPWVNTLTLLCYLCLTGITLITCIMWIHIQNVVLTYIRWGSLSVVFTLSHLSRDDWDENKITFTWYTGDGVKKVISEIQMVVKLFGSYSRMQGCFQTRLVIFVPFLSYNAHVFIISVKTRLHLTLRMRALVLLRKKKYVCFSIFNVYFTN